MAVEMNETMRVRHLMLLLEEMIDENPDSAEYEVVIGREENDIKPACVFGADPLLEKVFIGHEDM